MPIDQANPIANQIGQTIHGYRLDKLLGCGSFGAVYSSFPHNSSLAVKLSLDPKTADNEVDVLRTLHGISGIPQIRDFGVSEDFHVIVTQLGYQSLFELRRKNNGFVFSRPTVQKILFQAIEILEAIHGLGVCHQDLKDDNILVTIPEIPNNKVTLLITDFGLARTELNAGIHFAMIGNRGHDTPKSMRKQQHSAIDDCIQLSYSAIDMSTNSPIYSKYDFDESLDCKVKLLRDPSSHLPEPVKWLCRFFECLGENEDSMQVMYGRIKDSIQQSLPESDASSELHLNYSNYQYSLL